MRHSTITVTARGPAAIGLLLLLIFALLALPRLLATPPSADEATEAIRVLRSRRVSDVYMPRFTGAPPEARMAIASGMARELQRVRDEPLGTIRIRRSWIGPPFAYRWTYVVEVRREGAPPATYRIRLGIATEAPRLWWYFPLF